MNSFRVLLKASGLQRSIDGTEQALGLYATIFVLAHDDVTARAQAESQLLLRLEGIEALTARSHIKAETCERVLPEEVPLVQPGLTWYREPA